MLPRRPSSTLERPVQSPGREQLQAQTVRTVTELGRLVQHPGTRIGAGALAFALLTAVTYPIARYRMFAGFTNYDDEGYMLFALKLFIDRGWHYDGFHGYGPFYYEFWGAVFSVFGLPVNNDAGRTVTLIAWVLCSLIVGISTWRIARSVILGLGTQLGVFAALGSLVPEPMHPGSLIVLLLAVILAFSCFVGAGPARLSLALLGGAVAALLLVKINVGVFALAAVMLVCAAGYPAHPRHGWLRVLIEIGFVSVPVLLMRSRLDEPVARNFALHVCAAALAVVIALRADTVTDRSRGELRWLAGGLCAVALALPLVVLAAGTPLSELVEGLVRFPLTFGNAIFRLRWLPGASYLLDLVSLAGAFGYWHLTRTRSSSPGPAWIWLVAVLSITVGLFLAFPTLWSLARPTDYTTQYLPLFIRWSLFSVVWVALIPPPRRQDADTRFARRLAPTLAVLQALHAFPSAGSQMWWATFLLIPVGALCIANGARWITFGLGRQQTPRTPLAIQAIAPAMVLAVLICR